MPRENETKSLEEVEAMELIEQAQAQLDEIDAAKGADAAGKGVPPKCRIV